MGRKGKYKNSNKITIKINEGIIYTILILFSTFFNCYIIEPVMFWMKMKLFGNSETILIVSSLGLWRFLEFLSAVIFILGSIELLRYKLKQSRIINYSGKPNKKFAKYMQQIILLLIICCTVYIISYMSYCRIDKNKIYVREIRTAFLGKEFTWNDVEAVEIKYYKNPSKSGYNLQYLLKLDRFNINIQNSLITDRVINLNNKKREINKIVKEKNIPIKKEIDKYDDKVKEFLKAIGE